MSEIVHLQQQRKNKIIKFNPEITYKLTGVNIDNKHSEIILSKLGLLDCFIEIHGAPIKKYEVVQDIMRRLNIQSKDALLIGDSASDYDAATKNNLRFVLRSTALNCKLQKLHKGLSFEGLI